MAQPQLRFFDALQKYDPEFYKAASGLRDASRGAALDPKTRILITMGLDAVIGASSGVKALAKQARALGASEDEIKETLRLVSSVKLNQALDAAMNAFEE